MVDIVSDSLGILDSAAIPPKLLDPILMPLVEQVRPAGRAGHVAAGEGTSLPRRYPDARLLCNRCCVQGEDKARARSMAENVLRNLVDRLQGPIAQIVNGVLLGDRAASSARESDLADHVYELVQALHRIDTGLLLYIVPAICQELQVRAGAGARQGGEGGEEGGGA